MKKINIENLLVVAIVLATIAGVIYLARNMAFGFVLLVLLAMILIGLVFFSFWKHREEEKYTKPRRVSRWAILLTGLMAAVTMGSYFYPSSTKVYSNNDHHAIAIEGLETNRSSLLLAANSNMALFDNKTLEGSIELRNISTGDSTATLVMTGAGQPVYTLKKIKKKTYCIALDGQEHLHQFDANEDLELIGIDGTTAATLKISYYKKWEKLKRRWKANYILEYRGTDGVMHTDTSTTNSVILKRYSLASLFPGIDIIHGIDFTKIDLVRSKTTLNNDIKAKEAKNYPFIVAYENGAGLSALRSGDHTTHIGHQTTLNIRLDNSSYTIGLNSSIPQFRLCADTNGMTIVRFRMPQYRYLSTESLKEGEDDYFTFMVASTLIDTAGNINEQLAENILLYEMFDHVDNGNQMRPMYMSFHRGNTRTPLQVKIFDDNGNDNDINVKAGDILPRIATQNGAANWIVSLDNFKDPDQQRPYGVESPLSAKKMILYIIVFTLLCWAIMLFNEQERTTYIEPMVYIAIITLLAIRLMLMWRVSVFPPTMGITLEEFNGWRTANGLLSVITWCIILLPLAVFLYKIWILSDDTTGDIEPFFKNERWDFDENKFWHLIFPLKKEKHITLGIMILSWTLILFLGKLLFTRPWFCVGFTVIYYFIIDYFIHKWLGSRASDESNHSYSYFWHSLANSIFASGAMLICDGGYGIMFLVFTMLLTSIRLIDLYGANDYKNGIRIWGVLFFLVIVSIALVRIRPILTAVYLGGTNAIIAAAVAFAAIGAILAWTLGGFRRFLKQSIIIIALVAVVAGCAVVALQNHGGDHITNRVKVLEYEPGEILGHASSTKDMQKFLEASLNDWVLEEYEERGHDMTAFIGDKGEGYFKIQPHSKVGVSWMTQLSDLSVARFMIAEQSSSLPVLLIAIFALLTLFSMLYPADRRWAKSLLVQIPLLLTIQSLFVWMAVTRRFIFIGQDFPMISIIARVNTYMCFIGFGVWICVAIAERFFLYNQGNSIELANGNIDNNIYNFQLRFSLFEFAFLLLAGIAIVCFGKIDGRQEENTYNVEDCANAAYNLIANPKYNSIENLFAEYQDGLIGEANASRDNNHKIYDISRLGSHASIVRSFCQQMNYKPGETNPNSAIDRIFESDPTYGTFAKSAFDHYLEKQIEQNETDNLIYVVKNRYIDEKNTKIENVRYTFDLYTRYYVQHLPSRLERSWRGSVLASSTSAEDILMSTQEDGVRIYKLPSTWTRQHSLIVRPSTARLSVVGKYEPRHLAGGEAYNLTDGESLIGRGAPNLAKYGSGNYIARNVIINSRAEFIYPLQNYFYWANPISQQLRGYMNAQLAKEDFKNKGNVNKPVELTISTTLTKNLYRAIDNGGATRGNVAVVVADGDGYVRALIDHKKRKYIINPNDSRRIQQVEDSLKREGMLNRGREAELFFGNKALTSLDKGPGSSQKPLVWTAVTSQYSGWEWNDLQMACINNNLMPHGERYNALSWAGQRIDPRKNVRNEGDRGMFRSKTCDEGGGVNNVDVRTYMRSSSNYYNAIMAHIGSFTREELDAGRPRSNQMFKRSSASWTTDLRPVHKDAYIDSIFPLLIYDNNYLIFARPLDSQHATENDALLLTGLRDNFKLPTEDLKRDTSAQNNFHPFLSGKIRNHYAYPEFAYFNNKARNGLPFEIARDGVKMTAIGQNTVWLVSPLAMAEMYGKLISFNRNYRLTIDCNSPVPPYAEFITDGPASRYLAMRNQQFILGLNDVFTSNSGTAHGVYTNEIREELNRHGYHIYGKTGTIDKKVKDKNKPPEDHLLAVIITNRDLTQLTSTDDYANLKFYVIYIADFNFNDKDDPISWRSNDARIINTVLQSTEFKQYMEGGIQ